MNNRKYLTSTGMLLKSLNDDPSSHQSPQQQAPSQQQQQQQSPHMSAQAAMHQQYMSPHMTGGAGVGQQPSQHQFQNMLQNFNPAQAAAAAAAVLLSTQQQMLAAGGYNQMQQPNANMDYYKIKPVGMNMPVPDIMVLPGQTSQTRWPNKRQNHHGHHGQSHKHQKTGHKHHQQMSKKQSSSSLASAASSAPELVETFGVPANITPKTSSSFYHQNQPIQRYSTSSNSLQLPGAGKEPAAAPDASTDEAQGKQSESFENEIEIISENFPASPLNQSTNGNNLSSMNINATFAAGHSEESFKAYLSKAYSNVQLAIAAKPQSNFISNLSCINQILTDHDYYSKIRRRKPYSILKIREILIRSGDSDDEGADEKPDVDLIDVDDDDDGAKVRSSNGPVDKQIIVIDDSNEEIHKPWITPELIKLIKHRNLLQAKISEKTKAGEMHESTNEADAELMKKFKNLRNKVTKLVKKARKDYLQKYAQESKENKPASEAKPGAADSEAVKTTPLKSEAPPATASPATPNMTTMTTTTATVNVTASVTTTSTSSQKVASPASSMVSSIVKQITASDSSSSTAPTTSTAAAAAGKAPAFLQNVHNVMMSLYNTYYNQYLQQYAQQQQQAQTIAAAAAAAKAKAAAAGAAGDEAAKASAEEASNYEILKQQATFYAQQQQAVQTQLETQLTQTAQQLVQDISALAALKTTQQQQQQQQQQQLLMNQFSSPQPAAQVPHHLMQMHHHHPMMHAAGASSAMNLMLPQAPGQAGGGQPGYYYAH